MKHLYWPLFAAALLAGCNQTPPVAETPATSPAPAEAPALAVPRAAPDSAAAPAERAAPAPPPPAAALSKATTLKMSFRFRPAPNPDDPRHPKTSAHLLLQGPKPLDIDLGKFAGQPDIVDAAKARLAGFPAGMLLGFRSYHAASGTSSDLAVLSVAGNRLRIVQRRVEETAAEPGTFETAREIPLPANTVVVAAPIPAPAQQ